MFVPFTSSASPRRESSPKAAFTYRLAIFFMPLAFRYFPQWAATWILDWGVLKVQNRSFTGVTMAWLEAMEMWGTLASATMGTIARLWGDWLLAMRTCTWSSAISFLAAFTVSSGLDWSSMMMILAGRLLPSAMGRPP